jgi:hypothetical protein
VAGWGKLEQFAELLADLGAAGFAGQQHAFAQAAKTRGKALDLRGLAAAFAAFEGDEKAACHGNWQRAGDGREGSAPGFPPATRVPARGRLLHDD